MAGGEGRGAALYHTETGGRREPVTGLLVCLLCVFTAELSVCSFSCLLGKFSMLPYPGGKKTTKWVRGSWALMGGLAVTGAQSMRSPAAFSG